MEMIWNLYIKYKLGDEETIPNVTKISYKGGETVEITYLRKGLYVTRRTICSGDIEHFELQEFVN